MTSPVASRAPICYAQARAMAERERAIVLRGLAQVVIGWLRRRLTGPRRGKAGPASPPERLASPSQGLLATEPDVAHIVLIERRQDGALAAVGPRGDGWRDP